MASTALQKLMFVIGMVDQVSSPAARVTQNLKAMTDTAKRGFASIAYGSAGVVGAALGLNALVEPARDFNRAMGEVRSLGVANTVLKDLERTALRFSIRYGESAADFVRSSYDIQSAIAGLAGNELSIFTEAGGVLAKATKADMATVTSYMGTMYGVFQTTAEQMGKSAWVQQMTGQTALAVQMFKTNGGEMAAGFGALGASATSAGIEAAEQIAILGQLQATMSGSQAATRYRAFLAGVGKAQESLGMQFTDAQGRMLGMVDIIGKLKARFGDTLEVSESDALLKAFGSNEAVALIQMLMQDTAGLARNIETLGNVRGMQVARDMAASMVDPFDRMSAGIMASRIALGKALLPVLEPLVNRLTAGADTLTRWTQLFPNLTRWVGVGVVATFGLIAAMSGLAFITGISQLAWAGLTGLMAIGPALMTAWGWACAAFTAVLKGARIAVLLFNLALMANPFSWIALLIVVVIAAVAALIVYWDKVVAGAKRIGAAVMDYIAKPLQTALDLFKSLAASRPFNLFGGDKTAPNFDIGGIDTLRTDLGAGARLNSAPRLDVPQGGIVQQLNGGGGNIYHVSLQPQQPMGPQDLNSWMAMNAP